LPGNEECTNCLQDLTPLDRPLPHDRVEKSLMEDLVNILKPKTPMTISPQTSVQQALQNMLGFDIGALLVVDAAGNLLGIFSERDLLTKVAGIDRFTERPVSEFMTPNPETVTLQDTLNFALHKMDCGGYRHLPVVENKKPVGMISVRDMLRHITKLCKEN
jgi:CBS domain-containing protein